MKKILFLLLLIPLLAIGQQPQEFDYGIQNNASAQDLNPVNIVTQGTDGVYGNITPYNLLREKAYLPTGLLKNGALSINAVNTTYDLSAGTGVITNFDNPDAPTSRIVTFPAVIGKTPTYLTTAIITYVGIQEIGTTGVGQIIEQSTPFTTNQNHDLIPIGAVIHSNLTNINVVNNITNPSNDIGGQFHAFLDKLGAFNVTGNKFTANGANLGLNKSAGSLYKRGSNFINNWKNANEIAQSATTYLTFRYRTQIDNEGADRVNLDPSLYDVGGVLTAVPVNKYTIQTVNLFQEGAVRVQWGQTIYNSLAEAEAALPTRAFVKESNIALQAVPRAYVILKNTTTSLLTAADAKIIEAGKFDGFVSGGAALTLEAIISALGYTPANIVSPNFTGTPTAPTAAPGTNTTQIATTEFVQSTTGNMQTIYNNSTSPQITTTVTDGAFVIKRGSAADTDNILAGQNGAGINTFTVKGSGNVNGQHAFFNDVTGYATVVAQSRLQLSNNAYIAYGGSTFGNILKATSTGWESGIAIRYDSDLSETYTIRSLVDKGYADTKAPSSGSANYIQNGTTQQTANLNISGSGTFGGNLISEASGNPSIFFNSTFNDVANRNWRLLSNRLAFGEFDLIVSPSFGTTPNTSVLNFKNTGAATFSSSVTATDGISINGAGSTVLSFKQNNISKWTMAYASSINSLVLNNGTTDILKMTSTGAATFSSSVTAGSFVKTGGLASQNLKADGSVSVGYKVYTALLTQTGTTAPVATVLENTLGVSPTLSYFSDGYYRLTATNAFPSDKTILLCTGDIGNLQAYGMGWETASIVRILSRSNGVLVNGQLLKTSIEIRVYN